MENKSRGDNRPRISTDRQDSLGRLQQQPVPGGSERRWIFRWGFRHPDPPRWTQAPVAAPEKAMSATTPRGHRLRAAPRFQPAGILGNSCGIPAAEMGLFRANGPFPYQPGPTGREVDPSPRNSCRRVNLGAAQGWYGMGLRPGRSTPNPRRWDHPLSLQARMSEAVALRQTTQKGAADRPSRAADNTLVIQQRERLVGRFLNAFAGVFDILTRTVDRVAAACSEEGCQCGCEQQQGETLWW